MKKTTIVASTFVIVLGLMVSACSSGANHSDSAKDPSGSTSSKPVSLTAVITSGYGIDYATSPYFQALEKQTNIHLDLQTVPTSSQDKINLMFASRKFPDLMFRTNATDKQMMDAVAAGDILPLNDLIAKYAPNWSKILKDHPEVRKAITFPDGKIYSLPTVMELPEQVGIRDQWLINKKWLDQLGLKVPTTTDEFEADLKAFKDHAGEGAIPKNAIPWYFTFNQYVGGQMDIYGGSFGILAPDNNYLAVSNGKVQFQAMNPDIQKPLAYLHQLYTEGLIPPEAFTDDWAAYSSKVQSNPAIVGSYSSFISSNPDFVAMLPPKAPGVSKQLFRQQTGIVVTNRFTITKNNPDPVASIKLADVMAEPDWTVQDWYGMFGDKYVKKDANSYTVLPIDPKEQNFPNVDALAAITPDVAAKIKFDPKTTYYARAQAVEMYKPVIAPLEDFYPNLMFLPDESDKLAQLRTDINGYVQETFAKWITKGGMEAEWPSYINKLKSMKVDSMIQILQTALDRYNKG